MDVLVSYRGIPQSPGWATGDAVVQAFRDLGHNAWPYGRYHSQVPEGQIAQAMPGSPLGRIPTEKIDLLVYMEMNDADPQYQELFSLDCKKISWSFDDDMHPEFTNRLATSGIFAKMYFGADSWAERLQGTYLPYAVDDRHFKPGAVERRGTACIGTAFKERRDFCNQAGVELISGLYREEYVTALQKLKIHVHYHNSGGSDLLVMRIWETLGCGALLMMPENEECLGWSFDGTSDGCRRELESFGRMRESDIAQEAKGQHDHAMKHHTYRNRCKQILEDMG